MARRKQAAADGTRHVKKSPGLLCQRIELRYAFISEHQQMWPVTVLCAVLPVSRSGFLRTVSDKPPPGGRTMG